MRDFHNFKSSLGLERSPPSLVRKVGLLVDREVADLNMNFDIYKLDGAYC